jgi:hypothetical protein
MRDLLAPPMKMRRANELIRTMAEWVEQPAGRRHPISANLKTRFLSGRQRGIRWKNARLAGTRLPTLSKHFRGLAGSVQDGYLLDRRR